MIDYPNQGDDSIKEESGNNRQINKNDKSIREILRENGLQAAANSGDGEVVILIRLCLDLEQKMRELESLRAEMEARSQEKDLSWCLEKAIRLSDLTNEILPIIKAIQEMVIIVKGKAGYCHEDS